MTALDHYSSLLSLVALLEEVRAKFHADHRRGDDPTNAYQATVDALTILHSVLSDMEARRVRPRHS